MTKGRYLTRAVKLAMLRALKDGFFDEAGMSVMQGFLFPDGKPMVIEIIDTKEQLERSLRQEQLHTSAI